MEEVEADPPRRIFGGMDFVDCHCGHYGPDSKTSFPTRPKIVWQGHHVRNPARIFQDSSLKNVYTKKGDGVGDLKGIYFILLYNP